jgi:hypothetical protein
MQLLRIGWGASLRGDDFELEDWRDTLKLPFDPWVVDTKRGLVLRSKIFDSAVAADEVYDRAVSLISMVNGALALWNQTAHVNFHGVIEFLSDGSERYHPPSAQVHMEGRSKFRVDGVVVGPDGQQKAGPPKASDPQRWIEAAKGDDALADALIYYSRADNWFDIYKALECLFIKFGGEEEFIRMGWKSRAAVKALKRTADNERHARLKNKLNRHPMNKEEARRVLRALIKMAFIEIKTEARDG